MSPIYSADCGAAASRCAFIARKLDIAEIGASRPLKEIAAERRHVAQLL
jgi:hypothetical protein